MYKNMTYQQAKRIRSQSISSVLADQLIMGAGYGAAIKQTASAKFNAKLSGIKEKFDPLNIAKFLTGGSRLGPAILGKMLGRSRKDIEYFTGRARPVQYRGPRIGKTPGSGGDGLGAAGGVLNDILTFLQKSHTDNMTMREKENNFREGKKHEDERRHNDLLKALNVKPSKNPLLTSTATKEPSGSPFSDMLSVIKNMIEGAIKGVKDFIGNQVANVYKWVGNYASKLGPIIKNMVSASLGGLRLLLANPMIIAALLAVAALYAYKQWGESETGLKKQIQTKENEASSLQNQLKYISPKLGAGQDNPEFIKKTNLLKEVENKKEILVKKLQLLQDQKPEKQKGFWDSVKDVAGFNSSDVASEMPIMPPPAETTTKIPQGFTQLTPEQVTKAKQEMNTVVPPVVPVTPASSAVSTKTNENRDLSLKAKTVVKTEKTNTTNIKNVKKSPDRKISMPSVRNNEETFARLIWDSTRVV